MQKLSPTLIDRLNYLGISSLNKMQEASMETMTKSNNLLLLSPTGTGKTLAFLLPLLEKIDIDSNTNQTIIIAPSRELAIQINDVFKSLQTKIHSTLCYGGHSIDIEIRNLSSAPQLIIGTPGRIVDHIKHDRISPQFVHTLILDEFDKSLEVGFEEEMRVIVEQCTKLQNRILCSATNAVRIPDFVGFDKYKELDFINQSQTNENVVMKRVISPDKDKLETLDHLLRNIGNHSTLVFCNHRESLERVREYLDDQGFVAEIFHGKLEQNYRESALIKFRNKSCNILIATDLAARGIDVDELEYIVHYHIPRKLEEFTHRNGRTARMNASGTIILLQSDHEDLPDYVIDHIDVWDIDRTIEDIEDPEWETLYIGAGKKEKVNKIDIVGFLTNQGKVDKNDIGLITVKDHFSYVAVKREGIVQLIKKIRNEKIKKQKVKIEIAK
jgi:ATP-independent RNA helicase DbpA